MKKEELYGAAVDGLKESLNGRRAVMSGVERFFLLCAQLTLLDCMADDDYALELEPDAGRASVTADCSVFDQGIDKELLAETLMLCDALEFLPMRNGLLRVRMSVDGVWAD